MSRRDRANRFSGAPDFREIPPISAENKPSAANPPKSEPIVVEESEQEKKRFFQKIGAFFSGCSGKIVQFLKVFSKAIIIKPWGWCRFFARVTWTFLRKIPSYCVIRWNSKKTEEIVDDKKASPTTISGAKVNTQPAIKRESAQTESKTGQKVNAAAVIDTFDEDEPAVSRWWNIGIKMTAAAAAMLVLAGGFFIVKPLLFKTPTKISDAEVVEITDQTLTEAEQETVVKETSAVAIATAVPNKVSEQKIPEKKIDEPVSVPAVASPAIAEAVSPVNSVPVFPDPPKQPEAAASAAQPSMEPQQGSLFDDPFLAAPSAPQETENTAAVAAVPAVPAVSDDPFGSAPISADVPAPADSQPVVPEAALSVNVAANTAAKNTTTPQEPLAELQPLTPNKEMNDLTQLQPFIAQNTPAMPAGAVPAAVESSTNAPIASSFRDRRNARRDNANQSVGTSTFDQAPSPPAVVSTIPPENTASTTLPVTAETMAEPVKEIIPQIPHTGNVEDVPPPAAPPVLEAEPVRAMSTEPAPAIPKDALNSDNFQKSNVVPAPPTTAPELTEESVSDFLPMTEPPVDRQLREQLRELRNDESGPATLRFTSSAPAAKTSEPALVFTPKQTSVPADSSLSFKNEGNLLQESVNQFRDTQPSNVLSPDSNDVDVILPALENAPPPVFAEIQPKYRGDQTSSEKGMTFQSRINSAIKRSPSEMETYTIQQGDTYLTISERFYGTSLLYSALAAHNQKSGIGWRPAEGVVIEVPTAEYLRANYGESAHRQERRLQAQRSAIRYIVQEGDTIFRLATDKLRDSTRWKEIYALNTDRIQDVRVLTPGMEILLPAEPVL